MSPQLFGVALVVGAAALAAWMDVRVPRLAPGGAQRVILHAAGSMVLLHFVAGAIGPIAAGPKLLVLFGLLGFALPALAYSFLTGIWAIKLFTDAYGRFRG